MDVSTGYPQVQHQAVEVLSSGMEHFCEFCGSQGAHNCCATLKTVFSNVCNKTAISSA